MIKVSIVIPVYNNFEVTKRCIDSINNLKFKTSYEIIIADDGSTDETQNIEKYYNNVRLIKTSENSGFLLNVNNAVPHAKGTYILLMNNDMIAKPKFLDYLYNTISKNKEIGVVGAMMLNEDGTIQEVGATVFEDGTAEWNCCRWEKVDTSKTYEVDYSSGCGIMFLKEDWDKLGGFDEDYKTAYYEDVDLCYKIKYELGKKIICQPKAQIYHLWGKTYSENDKRDDIISYNRTVFLKKWADKLYKTKELKKENYINTSSFSVYNEDFHKVITILGIKFKFKSRKLMEKYGIPCNSFFENIFSVKNIDFHKVVTILGIKIKLKSRELIENQRWMNINNKINKINKINTHFRDNNSNDQLNLNIKLTYLELMYKKCISKYKTILYIDWHIFAPDTNAGDRASYSYFKALLQQECNLIYLPQVIEPNTRTEYFDLIKDYGVEILVDENNNINYDYLKAWFQKNGELIDYVFINRPDAYVQYEQLITKYLKNAKKIYQGHDIHFLRLSRMAKTNVEKIIKTDIDNMKKIELSTWEKMDIILYFSNKEIEIVKSLVPEARTLAVPLFLYSDIKKINYNSAERQCILFVGSFNHPPNADAMRWFITDIFPIVLKSNPDIKLNIIGSNCPQDIVDMANENVIIHGYLSDDDLEKFYNKTRIVIAPLRYGAGVKGKIIEAMKNQIPVVTTDIGAEGINSDLLTVANSEEDFANAILNLYKDNEKLVQISTQSYDFIKNNFSENFINKLISFMDEENR